MSSSPRREGDNTSIEPLWGDDVDTTGDSDGDGDGDGGGDVDVGGDFDLGPIPPPPDMRPWRSQVSVDGENSAWRSASAPATFTADAPRLNGVASEPSIPVGRPMPLERSQSSIGRAAEASTRARKRWRKAITVVRSFRLEPLRVAPEEWDRPLPTSPLTTEGELANGMRYFVRSCRKPPGRAVLRLVVRAGSVHEEDDQLGLAHFLEHTAFMKTRSYDKGKLIKFIEGTGAKAINQVPRTPLAHHPVPNAAVFLCSPFVPSFKP